LQSATEETVATEVRGIAQPEVQRFLLYDALDCSPALIFVADHDMQYLAVNQTACDTLGYTREELLSLHVTDVAVAPEAPETYREMRNARSHAGSTQIRTKDGRLLPLSYHASEVKVAGMQYYLSIGFIDDE
jgi:PAS domain S-box-containing protein